MKTSWRPFFRRIARVCLAFSATMWSSALCYAQVASDNASNAPYTTGGWLEGQNGGTGFGPWSFEGSYNSTDQHSIDNSTTFNQVGTAWRLSNTVVESPPSPNRDISRAGRSIPLGVGQTLTMVVDNPTQQSFFRGYIIRLSSGGSNICPSCGVGGESNKERLGIFTFNYDEFGRWEIGDSAGTPDTTLLDTDTDAGVRIEIKLTGAETYDLKMTPLDGLVTPYTRSGSLGNAGQGPINWLEFVHFDVQSDPTEATDFYIRSLEVSGGAAAPTGDFDADHDADGADFLAWQRGFGLAAGAARSQGDSNGDMDVDAGDLATWRVQFGSTGLLASSVPEPAGPAIVFAGLSALWLAGAASGDLHWRRSRPLGSSSTKG